jgi:tRNA1Val (adenine37-N6)-methyltransferase
MSIFKFKQFEVDQAGCAMKINTDGVLLAAMANHEEAENILDIGSGTGVIALMLAQRFPEAHVHAVEIDQQAAETAGKNFKSSVFNDRLTIDHVAIEQYHHQEKFDMIVSNPPFFVNDLKNEEARKGIARHADHHFFNMLVQKSNELLSDSGMLWLILPVKQANEVVLEALKCQLSLVKRIYIHSDESKAAFRQVIGLGRIAHPLTESHFYIYQSRGKHTESYEALLSDFFLAY